MKYLMILACCVITCSAFAKTSLRYKASAGDKATYKISTDQSVSVMGQDNGAALTATVTLKAEAATNDRLTFVSSFDALSAKLNQPMMGLTDTTITPKELTGKRTRLSISPAGKVLATEILDSVAADDPILGTLDKNSAELKQPWVELAPNPVAIGDTWTIVDVDSNGDANGKIYDTTKFTFTYTRNADTLNHSCAVLGYTMKISVGGNMHLPQGEIDVDGEGTGAGTAWFDAKKGLMIANSAKSSIDQNLTLAAMQKTITQTQSTNMQVSIVE